MSIAMDLAAALDPARFAERAGIAPDGWQADVLRSTAPRMLLNCSRQSGKSTTTAVLAMHTALYQPDSLILLLSPSLRQSQELFRKCLQVYGATARTVEPEAESALRLELTNGSRLVSLPGKEATVRGYSGVRLLLVDEASRVDDSLYSSVRPMLAVSQGRLIALSTPWGARGWWHAAWTSDEPWLRVGVPATECPRISSAFLAEERRSLGDLVYRSEYGCEFVDTEDSVFSSESIAAALDAGLTPLFGRVA